jgi:hypothetical protein
MKLCAGMLVELLGVVGAVVGLSPAFLGATVLAWGSSVADLAANAAVARKNPKMVRCTRLRERHRVGNGGQWSAAGHQAHAHTSTPALPLSRGEASGLEGVSTRPAGYPTRWVQPAVVRKLHLLTRAFHYPRVCDSRCV